MAKISLSDLAPASASAIDFSFAGAEFSLKGDETFATEDRSVLASAEAHPWLKVERDAAAVVGGTYFEQVRPEDDGLSAHNTVAFDIDKIKQTEDAKREALGLPAPVTVPTAARKPAKAVTPSESSTQTAKENN